MPGVNETSILELGTKPIVGPLPSGSDAADDEDYLAVLTELGKVDRIDTGDPPDWHVVEQRAVAILREKSKDFEMAAALGHALFQLYTYQGLATALAMLAKLVENFWDTGFPSRPRRRKARIEALATRMVEQKWFRDHPPQAADFDAIEGCLSQVAVLEAALIAKMPDEPPDFAKFVRALKELLAQKPKPTAAPPASATPATGGASHAVAAGEIADASSANKAILAACTFLRKADPQDPIPYGVVRVLRWSPLSLPPGAAATLQIDPPEAATVEALAHQSNNGLWNHLLQGAEGAFRSSDPLWLDLQRYVCQAMAGLGTAFDNARLTVMGLTAALVQRLGDGVFELRFRNGIPLCSGPTKMWLETEVIPSKSGQGAPTGGETNGRLSDASRKAKQLVSAGKLKEALETLQDGLAGCTQRRDRFLWRLGTAQLCFEADRLQLAGPLLEECYEEIRRFRIDEWEPSLAVAVAQTLYRCRKSLSLRNKTPAPEMLDRLNESFAWLCQLDPLAALATEPAAREGQ